MYVPLSSYILVPRSWGSSRCLSLCLARRLLGAVAQTHGALLSGLVTEGAMAPGPRASLGLGTALP